jgi:predicted MFS family arabinose efflux permease
VINVFPIAATLILLVILRQKDVRKPGMTIDYLGAVLCVLGLGGPVYALIEQGHYVWGSPVILVPFIAGILCFAGFLVRQKLAKMPLMPLSLFAVRNFRIGNVSTALVYAALSIGGFIISVFLQQVAGFPATLAALATLPLGILNIALSSWVGSLSGRFGPRLFMGLGPIVGGLGYLLMLGAGAHVNYWTQLLPGVLLFGLGVSATVAPLTATILGSISESQAGIGSAVNNAVSRVAGLIAIAFLGLVIGSHIDVAGFHRTLILTAVLLFLGGIVSLIGIQNSQKAVPASSTNS